MPTQLSTRCIAVDARCLQDPNYAGRGVGRHTVNLLRNSPIRNDHPLVGICDPQMPQLDGDIRALFDGVRPNAQFQDLHDAACFVSPSPMTHDPLFVARLLHDPRPLKATVVYDFIPLEFPDRYLAEPAARHAYYTCLRWLSRYDLFMPISAASSAPLKTLLGVPDSRITVTGAALDLVFDAGSSETPPEHLLVIGGGDPRKNVECAIRAHAAAAKLQGISIPLVITGSYHITQIEAFREIAASLGGDPSLLRMPGHVPEMELVQLYRTAFCVVAPSRAEGFDLPVVEAMALGTAVLASDIPAHHELIETKEFRFQPDDDLHLASLLSELVTHPAAREHIVAAQASIWPRYRAASVGERFWEPIAARLAQLASPSVLRQRRPRLAMLSPVPPDRSGIAHYTAATCEELGKIAELHLFTETKNPGSVPGAATVRPLTAVASLSGRFDRVIHVMGNNAVYHRTTFDQLMRYGGACIAHDSRMLGFYRDLGMDRAIALASAELGRQVPLSEIEAWLADEASLEAMHLGEMVSAADPTFVHSRPTARLMEARYDATPVVLPFCIYRPWNGATLAQREAARRRLNFSDGEIIIATFGAVHSTKAPIDCIWALELLRGWGVHASLHFVGHHAEPHSLDVLASQLGLTSQVRFLDTYVTEDVYRDYLVAADLGVQLRLTAFGSLSGALLDCIAAGLPTVATSTIAEATDSPGYVRAIPDKVSPLLLAEALADLLDAGTARVVTEPMRQSFSNAHSFRIYSEKLCEALHLEQPT
jgi:glycosyltransferase involved in cell wall biosynthesis